MRSRAIRSLTTLYRPPALGLSGHRTAAPQRQPAPPVEAEVPNNRICPRFVRIALRRGGCTRKRLEFLDSSTHPQDPERLLSSCSNRIHSIPRPRLAFHVLVSEFSCLPGKLNAEQEAARLQHARMNGSRQSATHRMVPSCVTALGAPMRTSLSPRKSIRPSRTKTRRPQVSPS